MTARIVNRLFLAVLLFTSHITSAADMFWMQGNPRNLSQLMELAQTDEQRSAAYLLAALVLPKGDFNAQKNFLELAVRINPNSTHARYYGEYFALAIAEGYLNFYEASLKKAGIYRPLGMFHFEKDGVTPVTIAHEFFENTLHTLVYAFTSYPEYLRGEYSVQLSSLWNNRFLISRLRKAMEKVDEPTSIRELFKNKKKFHLKLSLSSIQELRETPFIRDLLDHGYMTQLPTLQYLGVPVNVDFINLSFSTIAVDLINIWNAAWLIGLPIGIHKLAHLAEDSKYFSFLAEGFEKIAHNSSISVAAEKLRSIPFGLGVIPAFIVVETADGCLIGIAKMAHDALAEAQLREGIEFKLDPKLFRLRSN